MKKQSDANYSTGQPESITFFLDRALGKNIVADRLVQEAKKLKELKIDVVHLENFFAQDALDEEWLKFVGEKSFVALTKDRRIRWKKSQRILVKRYGVRMFVLTNANITGEEMAEIFSNSLKSMCNFLEKNPAPFIATVSKSGTIKKFDLTTD